MSPSKSLSAHNLWISLMPSEVDYKYNTHTFQFIRFGNNHGAYYCPHSLWLLKTFYTIQRNASHNRSRLSVSYHKNSTKNVNKNYFNNFRANRNVFILNCRYCGKHFYWTQNNWNVCKWSFCRKQCMHNCTLQLIMWI